MAPGEKSKRPKFDASMRVVILHGPERYLVEAYTRELAATLAAAYGTGDPDDEEDKRRGIEQLTFDGATVDVADLLDELRSVGLFSAHKLVIVDAADKLLATKAEDEPQDAQETKPGPKTKTRGPRQRTVRELMETYALNPPDHATLLLRAEGWRPGRLDKAVAKVGLIHRCDALTEAEAARWCMRCCREKHGREIDRAAAALLVERVGPVLLRLDAELGKLAASTREGAPIGLEAIRELIGLSREEKGFVIQDALVSGSGDVAVTKLRELLQISREPEQFVSWAMLDLLRKVHTCSQLIHRGEPTSPHLRRLRIWGPIQRPLLDAARRLEPGRIAHLMRRTIEVDRLSKSGVGSLPRTLEVTALEIADTMSSA